MVEFGFQTTQVAAPTTGSVPVQQDVTISGIESGGPIKAVLITVSGATADDTPQTGARWGFGAADGSSATQGIAWSTRSDNGQTTSDTGFGRASDDVIQLVLLGGDALDGEARRDSWITDGVRLQWDDLPATAVMLEFTFFYGTDFDVDAHTFIGSTTDGGTESKTGLPFDPRMLIVLGGQGDYPTTPTYGAMGRTHFGLAIADTDGTITQGSLNFWDRDARPNTETAMNVRNDCVQQQISIIGGGTANFTTRQIVQSFDAGGYTMQTLGGTAGLETIVMAFRLPNNMRGEVRDLTSELAVSVGGVKSVEPGYEVDKMILIGSGETSINSEARSNIRASIGVASILGPTQMSMAYQSQDAQAFSNTRSLSVSNRVAKVMDASGGTLFSLLATGTDELGININVTDAGASNFVVIGLLLGSDRPNAEYLRPYEHVPRPNTLLRR